MGSGGRRGWHAAAVVFAAVMIGGCAASKPRIEQVTPRVTGIDWRGVDVAFDVTVRNPLPVALRAPGGRYAVEVGRVELVRSDAVPAIDVPGRDRGVVTLPARMDFAAVVGAAREFGEAAEVPYRLSGALEFSVAGQRLEAPFAHEGELPVLKMPRLTIKELKRGSVGFDGVSVTVTVELENPNVFALGVGDLGFDLAIGDASVGRVTARAPGELRRESDQIVELTAQVNALAAVDSVLSGQDLSAVRVALRGSVDTPYGKVPLVRE